jgi:hypothetical protein
MILSVCIPTIVGRESQAQALITEIEDQVSACGARDRVEIIIDKDNKEVSIGAKRQRMYVKCNGEYAVQIDDDDNIAPYYIEKVLEALKSKPDCVGYYERCTMDGVIKYAIHSRVYSKWITLSKPDNVGASYYRAPFFKDPIKTSICVGVGVKDMRFGEDQDFAIRVWPKLKTETFIPEVMYYYTGVGLTQKQMKERYGIK